MSEPPSPPPRPYKPDEEGAFHPLSRRTTRIGESKVALEIARLREENHAHAERLAEHLRLTDGDSLPHEGMSLYGVSSRAREQFVYDEDHRFPLVSDAERRQFERLVITYGAPLLELSPEVARLLVRLVVSRYFRATAHLRAVNKPLKGLFTVDELLRLMQHLHTTTSELARVLRPDREYQTRVLIERWLEGTHRPTGDVARRVEHLVERHVRTKPKQGSAGGKGAAGAFAPDRELSQTARERDRRARRRAQSAIPSDLLPLAESAKRDAKKEKGR